MYQIVGASGAVFNRQSLSFFFFLCCYTWENIHPDHVATPDGPTKGTTPPVLWRHTTCQLRLTLYKLTGWIAWTYASPIKDASVLDLLALLGLLSLLSLLPGFELGSVLARVLPRGEMSSKSALYLVPLKH